MKRETIYDRSLVDGIRRRQQMYDAYVAPKFDLDTYQLEMENPGGQIYAPEGYNVLDYVSDAFSKWQESRNSIEQEKALGDYVMEEDEYNNLLSVKQFLDDQKAYRELSQQVEQNPKLYEDVKDQMSELSSRLTDNAGTYSRYIQEYAPNTYKDDITKSFDSVGIQRMLDMQIKDKQNKLQSYLAKAEDNQKDIEYWSSKVSSYFNNKEQSTDFNFGDIDTYLYKVPGLMGSSAANYGYQALAMSAALLASFASGGAAIPLAGLALAGTIGARDAESKAEVYSNYREKVNKSLNKDVKNDVLSDARAKMLESGKYSKEQIDDDNYVLDQVLTGVIANDNAKFNNVRMKAKDGIQSLYTDNMALSVMDAAELAIQVMPLGAIAKAVKAIPGVGTAYKGAEKAASYAGNVRQQLSKRIDDVVTYGLEGVENIPRRRTVQRLVDLGRRVGITSVMEGAEEGIQYIKGQRFIDNEFEKDPNLLKSFVNNIGTGARSIFAAITPWDPVYSDDAEFMENFKGGALLGGLMTGVTGGLQTAVSLPREISATSFVANLYADKLDAKDRVRKNILYGQKLQKGQWGNVESAFDYLSEQGLDAEATTEIQEEKKRADMFRNTYTAPSTLLQAEQLGIDPRTEEYNTFVALKEHHEQLAVDTYKNRIVQKNNLYKFLNDEKVTDYLNSLTKEELPAAGESLIRDLIRNKAALDKLKELNERYTKDEESLTKLQKATGIRTSKSDVVKFSHMLNKDLADLQGKLNEQIEQAKQFIPNLSEEQLVVPSMHQDISDAMETFIAADMDNARAQEELDIMRSEDKVAVGAKIQKWNGVEDSEIEFVQSLDDFYNGKEQQKAEESVKEVKPVTLDNVVDDKTKSERGSKQIASSIRKLSDPNASLQDKTSAISQFEYTVALSGIKPTEEESSIVQKAIDELKSEGYEIVPMLNKPYHEGMKLTATFKVDTSLPVGSAYITMVRIPQVNKDGVMIQSADVVVSHNPVEEQVDELGQLRDKIVEDRNKYIDFSKKIKGEIRTTTREGATWHKLNDILKGLFKKVRPGKSYTYAAEYIMDNDGDLISDYYQDLAQIRDQLSDAMYEADEETIQKLVSKAESIIANNADHESYLEFAQQAKEKFFQRMLQVRADRFKAIRKGMEEQEAPKQTAVPVPPKKSADEKPASAEEAPTLGSILGPMLGAPTSQPIGTTVAAPPQSGAPTTQVPVTPAPEEPSATADVPLTYDPQIDTYSHRLIYWLRAKERSVDGSYSYVPKKYRGNDYLNNDDFALATQNRDFLQESTVEFEVTPFTDNNGNTVEDMFAVFTYKGQKYASYIPTQNYLSQDKYFQGMPYEQQKTVRNNLDALRNKILEFSRQKKSNPNLKIVPTKITSTNGRFLNEFNEDGSPKNRSLLQSAWLKEKDPYKITPSNTKIGIATGPISNAIVRYQDQIVSLRGNRLGSMQMVVEVDRIDGTTGTAQMQLNPLKLTDNDAAADAILKLVTSQQRDYVDANGVQTPITNRDMLSFLINFGDHTATKPSDQRLNPSQLKQRLSKQFYSDEQGNIMLGETLYTINDLLTDPKVQQNFKDYIKANFHFAIDEAGVNRNFFGGNLQSDVKQTGFQSVSAWMQNTGNTKITVIPGQIEFTAKDFGLRKYEGRVQSLKGLPQGISVLGWYIKNGWIQTNSADRMYDVGLWVDDVTTVNSTQESNQKAAQKKVNEQSKKASSNDDVRNLQFTLPDEKGGSVSFSMKDIFDILDGKGRKQDGPNFEANEPTNPINQINIEDAKAWLKEKLGLTDEQIEVTDAAIDVTAAGTKVMGRVRLDSIVLSEQAPEGVQYHEAWHRVSQLLISEKKRRSIYDKYNKRHKTNLTDKQIDEILAEDYRSFITNADQSIYTKGFNIFNWFKRIADFVRIWASTGQYTLAQLYTGLSRGKFANTKPNQDNVNRFKEIYKGSGPDFEIGGNKFDNISSLRQFDDIVKSLTYAFFQTNFTQDTIDYTDIKKLSNNFELLRRTVVNTANINPSPVMDEIVEKYDTVFKPAVMKRLKSLGIRAVDKNTDEEMSNIDAGETEGVNIGQHTVDGVNISIKDNAPAEVKMFFQTIPLYKLNDKGTVEAYVDPNTGFPQFVDEKAVWMKVLKDLAGSRTIANIITAVAQKAQSDLFYSALLNKLRTVIANSTDKDPNVSINAEALLSKLETVITSDINTFITVYVSNDDNGLTSMKLIDNTVDIKAASYPKVWSQQLFHNSGIFKYNKDGVVVAQDNAKQNVQQLVGYMKDVVTAFVNNKGILKFRTKDGMKLVDLHQPNNQEMFKQYLSTLLNRAGIGVDKATINTMLQSGDYGDPKSDQYTLLNKFVTSGANYGGFSRILEILSTIDKSIGSNGKIGAINISGNDTPVQSIYDKVGFVKALANAYAYTHSTDNSLSSLGPDGASYYMVSQNSFAKDRVSELNEDPELVQKLRAVTWNGHSLILDAVGTSTLNLETFINFKDSTSQDKGRDYFGITDREDYLAKMAAVFSDRIVFPTVADKKTYHFLNGVKLPHERLSLERIGNGALITYGDATLNTILGYAQDELNTIELTLRQIDDDPSHYRDGIHYNEDGTINHDWLPKEKRIKNYHTPNKYVDSNKKKHSIEGNGARFRFLTGVYVDGKYVSFNDPKKSAKENLDTARRYFFDLTEDGKKRVISDILTERLKTEIKTAKDLGIIENLDPKGASWGLRNKLLDDVELENRKQAYMQFDPTNAEAYAIIDMLADYMNNSIISVMEIEKIFSGDPAYYKFSYDEHGLLDISVDKIKRLGALTSTGINNRLDFFNDPIRQDYTVAELQDYEVASKQYAVYEDLFLKGSIKEAIQQIEGLDAWEKVKDLSISQIEEIYPRTVEMARVSAQLDVQGYKEGINVADAAVYISPNMFRDLMRMQGRWSPAIKRAFEILTDPETADKWESDPKLYAEANKVILNALKYMAMGTRFNVPGLAIPYFNKMALFPLFKSVATGDLKELYERMTGDNPIDMVMFNSAVKAGSESPTSPYTGTHDSEIELRDGQTVLSARQMEQAEDEHFTNFDNLHTYTQPFKYLRQQLETNPHVHEEQMTGTQFMKVALSNLIDSDLYGNDKLTGEEIKTRVMGALNRLSDIGRQELEVELFNEDGTVNIDKLAAMLREDAEDSDANDNILTALITENGQLRMPLDAISDNSWIESRFISLINKRTIDVNMPGGSFIQRSPFGLEASSNRVITPKMLNSGRLLKAINNEGSTDSIVSINLFKHIIPNYKDMTFTEARQWLIDKKLIGDEASANAIGYRIPTQSIASISGLRFVDVFPEIMGDTIMLPEDFTKLTGSDFDIDKLYVARYSYDNEGDLITDSTTQSGIKNQLLNAYMNVLLTPENANQLKLSIDNATGNVKAVLKDIESNRPKHYVTPFEVYTPTYQEARKAEYTGGKAGIGPFALNNAHHILTQLTKLKMVSNEFTEALDLVDLGKIWDDPTASNPKGGRILDWLSAMINGFVDIAKDPYIVRLNVNGWTYNMVSFLLRTGKGRNTFYFMSQPILKEMAEAVLKTKGKYGIDRTKSPSQLEKEAIESILDKYDPDKVYRKRYDNMDDIQKAETYGDLFREYLNDEGEYTTEARELIKGDAKDSFDFNERQIKMYYAFEALKPYADALADLVKYSKVDTKKMGKSFAEQLVYRYGMEDLKNSPYFEEGQIQHFYDDTFIETKTANSVDFGYGIFSNQLFRNTEVFTARLSNILSLLGRRTTATAKLLNPVIRGMEAQLKSEFFNSLGVDINSMFTGNMSIAKRLNNFKQRIQRGEYPELLRYDGTIANDFLEYLLPNINAYYGYDFIDTSEIIQGDQLQSDNLINYWRDLLEHPDQRVRKLAEDLAIYAWYTSGDGPTMNSFFKYLPNSYRISSGYNDFIKSKLQAMINNGEISTFDKMDILANNWHNDALVRPIDYYKSVEGGYISMKSITISEQQLAPNLILGEYSGKRGAAIRPINWVKVDDKSYPIFPPMVKFRDFGGFAPENWHLYQLIGYKSVPNETGRIDYTPVYALINKKGMKYRGHTIVQYGSDVVLPFNEEDLAYFDLYDKESILQYASDKITWSVDLDDIHYINELPSYANQNYAKAEQERVYEEEDTSDEDNSTPLEERGKPQALTPFERELKEVYNLTAQEFDSLEEITQEVIRNEIKYKVPISDRTIVQPSDFAPKYTLKSDATTVEVEPITRKTYSGIITSLEPNQVFVFGSNTQGRHGKGAALTARNQFGAVYGQAEGPQGQSYAIITKDLTKSTHPSRTREQMIEQIDNLYDYARQNPDKEFLVAYSGTGQNLNAYSNAEMAEFFARPYIPSNIVFEEQFNDLVEQYIASNINNTPSTSNAPVNFNGAKESKEVISSDKTILTNEELRLIRPYTGTGNPRIAVASEHSDPVFFSKKIRDILDGKISVEDKFRNTTYTGNDFAALYLITKHDGLPLKELLEYKIPKIIHFSITGLGGTQYEPGVMKPQDLLERIEQFIQQGLDPEMVTVRIDPIVPGVTTRSTIEAIVKKSAEIGIKNIRFSIMDQYSTTRQFMINLGYDYSKYYKEGSLHANQDVVQSISEFMATLGVRYGVKLSTCAEPINLPTISKEACLSVAAVNNMLGTSIPETATGKQRKLCSCYGGKTDLLRYGDKCASACVYCYAHHNATSNAVYYNEDGTLKDNRLTRTSETQSSANPSLVSWTALDIVGVYDQAAKRLRQELASLELTQDEMGTYENELMAMLRKENVTTVEQMEGVINKFLCNL